MIAAACFLGLFSAPSAQSAVIGHWLFNEISGTTANDSSGQGNHGTIVGGASFVVTPGTRGISLDGVNDYVNFGQSPLFDFTSEAFSIEAWVAIDGTQSGNAHGVFGKSSNSWLLGYEHGGGISARHNFRICGGAGCGVGPEANVGSALPFGDFKHMVATKSTFEEIRIYVDGVLQSGGGGFMTLFSQAVDVVAGRGGGNHLECIIDEIRLHDTYLSASEIADSFAVGPDAPPPPPPHPGRLNNMVKELINLDSAGIGATTQFDFTNPRDGWIFVSSTVAGTLDTGESADVSLLGPPADILHSHQPGETPTLESMRWLDQGNHSVTLQTTGAASLDALIVRAIPELHLWRYPASSQHPQQKPEWDWDALSKHILPSMNTINATRATVEENKNLNQPFFDEWNGEARRWTTGGLVPAYQFGPGMTVQQAYDFWAANAGYTDPDLIGMVVDEFGVGDFPNSQYTTMETALRQITTDFPDKYFYAFTVGLVVGGEPGSFMNAVVDNPGAIVWEWYEREEPSEAAAQLKLDGVFSHVMQQWRDFIPEAQKEIVVCLGYYSTPPQSLNENPAVDYKVWMDMQFHQMANDARFDGLRGVMEYNSKWTDEEVLRWQEALYRHYCIDGNTSRLSDTYGFVYDLTHVQNPDFDNGTTGWTIQEAESGSISSGNYNGFGRLEGRVRGSTRGDNFLLMTRSSQMPNRVVQQVIGLIPGELYTMKMFTADYQDYLGLISSAKTHAISIDLDNVDLIPARAFQQLMQSERGQDVPPWSENNQPWFNYYWRLFQAKDTTATLTISDWASDSDPGGPIGEQLMVNFIEIQPYFAIGNEEVAPTILKLNQLDVTALCFTGEVGKVYTLFTADEMEGPFVDTGVWIIGSGGVEYLFDPNHAAGVDTSKYYRVQSSP